MPGYLPLLHSGNVTLDEWFVFLGFALVIGLLTHWIDYRNNAARRLVRERQSEQQQHEEQPGNQRNVRREAGLDGVNHRVQPSKVALEHLPQR
ncbi:MAG: hypothetical protein DCC58_12395 [Chloroflexi bacterium]|nr:MAG: hypothetical protein DCC58_12395 [Chloroflexota bacterium]